MSYALMAGLPVGPNVRGRFPALDPLAHITMSLVAGLLAWIIILMLQSGNLSNEWGFALLTLLILAYSAVQAAGVYKGGGRRVLVNPTVFYAVVVNGLMLGVGGLLYLMPDDIQMEVERAEVDYWMNFYLAVMVLANIGLWSGYRSWVAMVLTHYIQQAKFLTRIIRKRAGIRFSTILILLGISLVARIATIGAGVFGYSTTWEGLAQSGDFRQYLALASLAGTFALLAVALDHFSESNPPQIAPWLFGVVLYEAFFGFISGFKSAVVMPFLIVVAVAYLLHGKILWKWLAGALIALVIAYMFIEPFRQFRQEEFGYKSDDIGYITEAAVSSREVLRLEETRGWRGHVAHFLSTQGNIPVYAEGVRYRAETEGPLMDPPAFLLDIFRAPILAVVPRAVWQEKPQLLIGGWYRVVVLQGPEGTSVGMSPVTYLYFAGGMLAVFLGFFAFGAVQSAVFHGFTVFGVGGAFIFLGLFSFMKTPDSVYYTYIIDMIRILPLLLLAQYLTFRPDRLPARAA